MESLTLEKLLDTLGPSVLRPIAAPDGVDTPVSGALIHDPRASLPPIRHAVLLAVGVRPGSAAARELVGQAGRVGLAGLVVKSYGEPVSDLAVAAEHAGVALLGTDEDMAWHHLDALVSFALAAAARAASGPAESAPGDLFALANAIAARVGGATAIDDHHRQILAYSTLPGQPIDDTRRRGILGLHVPDLPSNDAQYRELSRTARVCRSPADPGGLPRLAVGVRAGPQLLGSIWVVDADGLAPDAEQALAEAAHITALHLLAARAAADLDRRRRGDLLRRVLSDPAGAALVAPQLGFDADTPVAVAAFVAASGGPDNLLAADTAIRLADLVDLHYEAYYRRHGCGLIDGTVYALLPANLSGRAHRDLATDIARRAQMALGVPIRAGLGAVVAEARWAAASRQDADQVLRVLAGQQGEPDGPVIAAIDEVRASAMLTGLAQTLSEVPQLLEGIGPTVRAHDREHRTAYADTLLAYLDADSNVAVAAGHLNVHPNTCRYRVARAEEIFGFTLNDPDERLLLWLQLRLGDVTS